MQKTFATLNSTTDNPRQAKPRAVLRPSILKAICASLVLMTAPFSVMPTYAAQGGKVLVILSSADQIQLRDGKTYRTGTYIDESARVKVLVASVMQPKAV